jgi:hypothetical protein
VSVAAGALAARARPLAAHPLLPLALGLGAALIAGVTALRGVDAFDEGVVLQAARRVADGEVPYRDFLWSYGPAQPYLLGASFELFGTSLLGWRLLRVLVVAITSVVVFVLARRLAGTRLALLAWLIAACALAQPANASPFPVALLFALLAVLVAARTPPTARTAVLAGAVAALAASWRLDFGIYGAAAAAAALLLAPGPPGRRLRLAGWLALSAMTVTAVAYLPFALIAGSGDLYDDVVGKSLREGDYWTLPFPFDYDGRLRGWPPSALAEDAKDVLGFYLPLIVMAGLVVAVAGLAARAFADRRLPPAWAALLVLGAGSAVYLLSRTDEFHTTPLLLVLAVLLPAVAAWGIRSAGRAARAAAVAAACVLALLLAYGLSNRLSALFLPPELAALDVPAADGVRVPPREAAALERVVAAVQTRVPPGEPIYVAPRRSDLVSFENPMLYVLTERPNPLRRDVTLFTGAAVQRRIVRALERARPALVVRWTDPLSSKREPNRRGRPTGSRLLDDYLASRYRPIERLYHHVLLERR